jgi:cytochrome b6-f complex iron-sulfur subunit
MATIQDTKRRNFLNKTFNWLLVFFTILFCYPLFRFIGYTVKTKPRRFGVKAPLKAGGYHIHHEFILFVDNNEAKAFSRICTHLGCRVNFREELKIIECPCHQSRYTTDGLRVSGPAQRNLASLPVEIQKDTEGVVSEFIVIL